MYSTGDSTVDISEICSPYILYSYMILKKSTVVYLLTVKSVDKSVIRLQRINSNLVPSYTLSGENRSIYKSTGLIGSI